MHGFRDLCFFFNFESVHVGRARAMALRVFFLALLSACALAAEVFYYNAVTGAVQWTRPSEMPFTDSHGGAYWLVDGEVTRTPPLDWAWLLIDQIYNPLN